MRLYIYYIVCLALIYGTGCQNQTPGNNRDSIVIEKKDTTLLPIPKTGEVVTDADGNVYHTIIIGKQVWMAENLKVLHYNNGDAIPEVKDDKAWRELNTGAYCIYDNQKANAKIHGLLYNWHAVSDARKLAPKGWHIPSDAEWKTLIASIGDNTIAGSKLKATGSTYWEVPNTSSNNTSGFSALPSGNRNNNGTCENAGFSAGWWSTTSELQADFASSYSITADNAGIKADVDDRRYGMSVRCVRD